MNSPLPAQTGHFYFAGKRHFYFALTYLRLLGEAKFLWVKVKPYESPVVTRKK